MVPPPSPPPPPPPPPQLRHAVLLLADAQEWSARSLISLLSPFRHRVVRLRTGPDLVAAARAGQGDAILLTESLLETDVAALVTGLRADAAVPAEIPIVLVVTGPVSRPRLLAALRAGASDVWGLPMHVEELVLRIDALLRAKFAADRAREGGLVDEATGLYNRRGVALRARDLASQADRRRSPLACLVVAPAVERGRGDEEPLHAAATLVAGTLKQTSRSSDAIGRLGLTEFAVLAPDTDARGARQLGTRLGQLLESAGLASQLGSPLRLRAGYHVMRDFRTAGLDPLDLVARATSALRAAEAGGSGWLRAFDSGASG
jgi:PleD family two-component response regulator